MIVSFVLEGMFAIKLKSKVRYIDLQEIAHLHTYETFTNPTSEAPEYW